MLRLLNSLTSTIGALPLLIATPLFSDPGEARIFWTDKDDGQIECSDLVGGNRVALLSNRSDPRGIAVDTANNTIYWAEHNSPTGTIYTANCDGTNVQTFLSGLLDPADITLDLQNRLIYWAE